MHIYHSIELCDIRAFSYVFQEFNRPQIASTGFFCREWPKERHNEFPTNYSSSFLFRNILNNENDRSKKFMTVFSFSFLYEWTYLKSIEFHAKSPPPPCLRRSLNFIGLMWPIYFFAIYLRPLYLKKTCRLSLFDLKFYRIFSFLNNW